MVSGLCVVSGCAGFIGSHLVDHLLGLGCEVVGVDNFYSGSWFNIEEAVRGRTGFKFVEGDVCDMELCRRVCEGARYVFHQAAVGSVPLSFQEPLRACDTNSGGFVRMLEASREAGVERFVYASSSAVYGNSIKVPIREKDKAGICLSPYAASKISNECYASSYREGFGFESVGLRYFNVFGERQNPEGHYAAVIAKWLSKMFQGEACHIYGDGEASRDYSHVENIVHANMLAAEVDLSGVEERVFNVASGSSTTLNSLFSMLSKAVRSVGGPKVEDAVYDEPRRGDIVHSQADLRLAEKVLGYQEKVSMEVGLKRLCRWYADVVFRK